jgi:hydrogenase maturation protease
MIRPRLLVCGSPDRGDDAAALEALAHLPPRALARVSVDVVGQLGVEHLAGLRPGEAVVVVDAAVGLRSGEVRTLSFDDLRAGARMPLPRSSHELPIPEVVGIGELLAGPLRGSVVVIGGRDFSFGAPLSPEVRAALPAFAAEIEHAIGHAVAGTPATEPEAPAGEDPAALALATRT